MIYTEELVEDCNGQNIHEWILQKTHKKTITNLIIMICPLRI